MALLAFEDPLSSPLAEFLEMSHRQQVASELNAAILASQYQAQDSSVSGLLSLLRWSETQLAEKTTFPHLDLQSGRAAMRQSEQPEHSKTHQ